MDDLISVHFTPRETSLASLTLYQAYLRGGIQEEWASEKQLDIARRGLLLASSGLTEDEAECTFRTLAEAYDNHALDGWASREQVTLGARAYALYDAWLRA
jgi:hypothetical protein